MSQNAPDEGKVAPSGGQAPREVLDRVGLNQSDAHQWLTVRPTVLPVLQVHWSESWIVRAAMLASFILFFGFAASAWFSFESIDGVAKLAHDDEIEAGLGAHLNDLKRLHAMQQELLVERLRPLVAAYGQSHTDASEKTVRDWLKAAHAEELLGARAEISFNNGEHLAERGESQKPLRWLDRDRLQILGTVIEFPRGGVYEAFKVAEDRKQRYQLVGANINDNIRPTQIRTSLIVSMVSFLLLASIFMVYTRRFSNKIRAVIEGFALWSDKDSSFRFDDHYKGELKLITKQFNVMADDVEANRQRSLYLEKIASWQIIARKLAHEIKNPLTPIQMMVSQLKRRYKGDDQEFAKLLDHAQTIITEEVAGLRRMVDNFSNFARLPQPEFKLTDLKQLCQHVVALEQNVFAQHTITFDCKLASASAWADEDLLRQVLINLVKNAGEACSDQAATIIVGLTDSGADWQLTVADNGPGIAPENLDRIFEAYFTTKHTGPSPGMGLGLAVCQKIVIDHAGKMFVKSQAGETIFTIRLPRRRKDGSQP